MEEDPNKRTRAPEASASIVGMTPLEASLVIVVFLILALIALPGFIPPRIGRGTPGPAQTLVRIDSAVQLYIVEHELGSLTQFLEIWETAVADWEDNPALDTMIGPNGYLRFFPHPVEGGQFFINDIDQFPEKAPVVQLDGGEHVVNFPGFENGLPVGD